MVWTPDVRLGPHWSPLPEIRRQCMVACGIICGLVLVGIRLCFGVQVVRMSIDWAPSECLVIALVIFGMSAGAYGPAWWHLWLRWVACMWNRRYLCKLAFAQQPLWINVATQEIAGFQTDLTMHQRAEVVRVLTRHPAEFQHMQAHIAAPLRAPWVHCLGALGILPQPRIGTIYWRVQKYEGICTHTGQLCTWRRIPKTRVQHRF